MAYKEHEEMKALQQIKQGEIKFLKTTMGRIARGEFVSAALFDDLITCIVRKPTQQDLLATEVINKYTLDRIRERETVRRLRGNNDPT